MPDMDFGMISQCSYKSSQIYNTKEVYMSGVLSLESTSPIPVRCCNLDFIPSNPYHFFYCFFESLKMFNPVITPNHGKHLGSEWQGVEVSGTTVTQDKILDIFYVNDFAISPMDGLFDIQIAINVALWIIPTTDIKSQDKTPPNE